jgi:predicted nuclease with TOPRIM domain
MATYQENYDNPAIKSIDRDNNNKIFDIIGKESILGKHLDATIKNGNHQAEQIDELEMRESELCYERREEYDNMVEEKDERIKFLEERCRECDADDAEWEAMAMREAQYQEEIKELKDMVENLRTGYTPDNSDNE